MVSSGMLRRVALVGTDVSEELSASIRVTRIGEIGTTLGVTSNRRTLRRNTVKTSNLTSSMRLVSCRSKAGYSFFPELLILWPGK
jgi:hypothetical protein